MTLVLGVCVPERGLTDTMLESVTALRTPTEGSRVVIRRLPAHPRVRAVALVRDLHVDHRAAVDAGVLADVSTMSLRLPPLGALGAFGDALEESHAASR